MEINQRTKKDVKGGDIQILSPLPPLSALPLPHIVPGGTPVGQVFYLCSENSYSGDRNNSVVVVSGLDKSEAEVKPDESAEVEEIENKRGGVGEDSRAKQLRFVEKCVSSVGGRDQSILGGRVKGLTSHKTASFIGTSYASQALQREGGAAVVRNPELFSSPELVSLWTNAVALTTRPVSFVSFGGGSSKILAILDHVGTSAGTELARIRRLIYYIHSETKKSADRRRGEGEARVSNSAPAWLNWKRRGAPRTKSQCLQNPSLPYEEKNNQPEQPESTEPMWPSGESAETRMAACLAVMGWSKLKLLVLKMKYIHDQGEKTARVATGTFYLEGQRFSNKPSSETLQSVHDDLKLALTLDRTQVLALSTLGELHMLTPLVSSCGASICDLKAVIVRGVQLHARAINIAARDPVTWEKMAMAHLQAALHSFRAAQLCYQEDDCTPPHRFAACSEHHKQVADVTAVLVLLAERVMLPKFHL
jgi:hypothetical protein